MAGLTSVTGIQSVHRRIVFLCLTVFGGVTLRAQEAALEVEDLTPKFLRFYAAASKPGVDEQGRWRLWNQLYGFAAVPPTAEGKKMARSMLDSAWSRYAAALPLIKQGANAIHPKPAETLKQVSRILETDVAVRARLVVAVGGFEGNAFTSTGKDGIPTVSVEVEDPNAGMLLSHEFTHVVEAEQAGLSLDWKRSIAHTIFVEGLAMRVVQALHPGKSEAAYVGEFSPNWFERCLARCPEIFADLDPHLDSADSDTVMRYTMGKGSLGIERKAYFAGWLVIGDLLTHGSTFPALARVREEDMVKVVSESMSRLRRSSSCVALRPPPSKNHTGGRERKTTVDSTPLSITSPLR